MPIHPIETQSPEITDATLNPLPNGKMGLPVLGETLEFAKNSFRFIEIRTQAYGRVFKTRLLGRDTIILSGPEAARFFMNPEFCKRSNPLPTFRSLFGGPSLPMLDGKTHLARKTLVLEGFKREALIEYLPMMQKLIENAIERWTREQNFGWLSELKRLSMEVIFSNVTGVESGPELDSVRNDYGLLQKAFTALPINLPGTAWNRGLRARDRILKFYAGLVADHRRSPKNDGLSRILNAKTSDRKSITDHEAQLELHHIIVAGFIIFDEFSDSIMHLTRFPNIRVKLIEEIRRKAPSGPLNLEVLDEMPYLSQVIMEVKRLCHILPMIFGESNQAFVVEGVQVPKGWMLGWALRAHHVDGKSFSNPLTFDPDRFSAKRAEHQKEELAFVPHGPGPALWHKCPGEDYSTYFMKAFLVLVLREHSWELPAQNLDYNFKITPPEPTDGLQVNFSRAR